VAATTIETTAIAIVERIGRSMRLRRHAAAALNRHSIAGGLTGNFDDTNSARRLSELLWRNKPRSPPQRPSITLVRQPQDPRRRGRCSMDRLVLSTLAFLVGVATAVTARAAWAGYPERPVRIVVGFGAGSAADVAARIVAEELSQTMRQRFFIE